MSVATVHTLYAVNIDPITEANAVFIDQVQDQNLDPAIQEILSAGSGQVDPTHVAVMSQNPRIAFSTTALATMLAEVTSGFFINGIKIDSDGTHDGAELWFQKLAKGGTRTAGANHIKMTVNEGLLLPRSISAMQGQVASLAMDLLAGYDGTNDPIVIAAAQALEGTPAVGELFTLGPVSINGVDLDGVQGVRLDTGLQEVALGGSGQVWPTFLGIMSRQPLITITTLDVSVLSTYGLSGTAQSATDSKIYLRKIAEGGARVADATAQHLSFTIDEGHIRVRSIGGGHGAPQAAQLEIRPTYDGDNAILVMSAATAIT